MQKEARQRQTPPKFYVYNCYYYNPYAKDNQIRYKNTLINSHRMLSALSIMDW